MKLHAWLVIAFVLACGSGKKDDAKTTTTKAFELPRVAVDTVLAADDGKPPPALLMIDDAGKVHVNWAEKWKDLGTKDFTKGARTADLPFIASWVKHVSSLEQRGKHAFVSWDVMKEEEQALGGRPAPEDPPPPEEEDKPDDGEDESGGTGTAMALEEGKMGKKESDRAEGAYKMQKNIQDAALARRQITGARGSRGFARLTGNMPVSSGFDDGNGNDGFGPGSGEPSRLADVAGEVMTDKKLEKSPAVVLASPRGKAEKLIDVVSVTGAAIAVSHGGAVRPLRLNFNGDQGDRAWLVDPPWLEARVSAKGIAIEAVPDAVIDVAWGTGPLDKVALTAALEKARKARGLDPLAPVDVLVDPDVDVQRVIDVLVALDVAGVGMIGLGRAPTGEEVKLRGKRNPRVASGQPNAQGDLDKALIRRFVKTKALPKIQECYATALAKKPDLSGTVEVQFFIAPSGKVKTSEASGVDPDLATCAAAAIKAVEFPKPNGGGGVQVSYPFTMRP